MFKSVFIAFVFFTITSANEEASTKFLQSNQQFAADTYKQVARQKNNKNFVVCPLSAEIILSLAQNGARGKTRQEIRKALHLPNTTEELNGVFRSLLKKINKKDSYILSSANKIFIKQGHSVKRTFTKVATEIYQSPVENVDFAEAEKAAEIINKWVSQQTGNKIQNLVDKDSLSEDTVAILINALYLQAAWRKNFKTTLTQKRDFYKTEENVVQVETMKKADFYGYYESEELGARFLQILFKSSTASMVIVLPNEKEGLKKLESRIEKVYNPSFKQEFVEVYLPKFKIETSIDFKKVLKKLGVRKAFSRADFSGMAGERGEIYITDILQKTYIDVNEQGVEASAATAVFYHPKSLIDFAEEKKTFVADHPFLFYVVIEDVVVFTGRVVSP